MLPDLSATTVRGSFIIFFFVCWIFFLGGRFAMQLDFPHEGLDVSS